MAIDRKRMTAEERRARQAAYHRAYYAANRETVLMKQKAYNAKNKEAIAAKQKAYNEKNKGAIATWREANKEARAARQKAWYAQNRESIMARNRVYSERNPGQRRAYAAKNRERTMLATSQSSARKRSLEHNITVEDIRVPEFCPVTGIKLDRFAPSQALDLPSLDRVDSTRGYVKGNVRVISWRANQVKRDVTLEEARGIVRYMESHLAGEPEDRGTDE